MSGVEFEECAPAVTEARLMAFERLHYFFGLDDPMESCNLEWVMELTGEARPAQFIPIASDEAGNIFCLKLGHPYDGGIYFGTKRDNIEDRSNRRRCKS